MAAPPNNIPSTPSRLLASSHNSIPLHSPCHHKPSLSWKPWVHLKACCVPGTWWQSKTHGRLLCSPPSTTEHHKTTPLAQAHTVAQKHTRAQLAHSGTLRHARRPRHKLPLGQANTGSGMHTTPGTHCHWPKHTLAQAHPPPCGHIYASFSLLVSLPDPGEPATCITTSTSFPTLLPFLLPDCSPSLLKCP